MTTLRRLLAAYRRLPREQRARHAVADAAAWLLCWACAGLPPVLTPEADERIRDGFMAAVAAGHGEGMARKQLAAAVIAGGMTSGERAGRPAQRNGQARKDGND